MLVVRAIATASTEAQTDVAPFIPQNHGVKEANLGEAAFIPRGNATPMNRPRKERIPIATRIRRVVTEPRNSVMAYGVKTPKITRAPKRSKSPIVADPYKLVFDIFCVK